MQVDKFTRQHKLFNETNCNELLMQRQADNESFKSGLKPNVHLNHKDFLRSIYQMQISEPAQKNVDNEKTMKKTQEEQVKNFRRIRSEITLKTTTNFPFTCK